MTRKSNQLHNYFAVSPEPTCEWLKRALGIYESSRRGTPRTHCLLQEREFYGCILYLALGQSLGAEILLQKVDTIPHDTKKTKYHIVLYRATDMLKTIHRPTPH